MLFLSLFGSSAFSQSTSEFIVIDEIAENLSVAESQYLGHTNVFHTNGIKSGALEQISVALKNVEVDVLHIYVSTKPGALVFNSHALIPETLSEFSKELSNWRSSVSQEVIIHSENVFTGTQGELLKQMLEELTGLTITAKK